MAKKYIYIKYGDKNTNLDLYLFSDLFKMDNVEGVQVERKEIKNILLKCIRKVHLSNKLEKIIKLPMKWIWYDLSKLNIDSKDEYYILVPLGFFWKGNMSVIKKLKKMKNVKTVLIILDTVGVKTPAGELMERIYKHKEWDYIYSYDKNDCEKYNFLYMGEHYYSKQEVETNKTINNDAYFIGGLKPGRADGTVELFKYLQKNGVNAKFDIVKNSVKTLNFEALGFNILTERKPYSYVLDEVQSTNCIIEFLQNGQSSQTLRYFEAVCFNKKLLTNNKNVKNLSFYDERYMKIFEKLEDIDIDWVKRKEEINYNYNDEFAPNYIIEKLERL